MNKSNNTRFVSHYANNIILLTLMLLCVLPSVYGQQMVKNSLRTYLPFEVVSAEIIRFKQPIKLGVGKRELEYQEAMVLVLHVNQKDYEALPPSMAPYLYIGNKEYRIHRVQQAKERGVLALSFHVRNWQTVVDKAPMVLTILHGEDINKSLMRKIKHPLFNKGIIKDRR